MTPSTGGPHDDEGRDRVSKSQYEGRGSQRVRGLLRSGLTLKPSERAKGSGSSLGIKTSITAPERMRCRTAPGLYMTDTGIQIPEEKNIRERAALATVANGDRDSPAKQEGIVFVHRRETKQEPQLSTNARSIT